MGIHTTIAFTCDICRSNEVLNSVIKGKERHVRLWAFMEGELSDWYCEGEGLLCSRCQSERSDREAVSIMQKWGLMPRKAKP